MKLAFLTLVILLTVFSFAKAQNFGGLETYSLKISSLNTAFATQGDFEGEYRIFPDRIELKLTKAEIYLSDKCPYKGRRRLSSLKFGLATNTEGKRWNISYTGQELFLNQIMYPKDLYSLGELYFIIPIDNSVDLSKHWFVAEVEESLLDVGVERKGYAYAHSYKDVFRRNKSEHLVQQ
jgi:hypothetical protein